MTPDLSVVVLCYKSGKDIIPFSQRMVSLLEQTGATWELVLVGNYNRGDTNDQTPAIVRKIAEQDPRIKAITLVKEGWMGWDARTGLNAATGKAIALIDGDNQMPPEDVLRVYEHMTGNNLDLVTTFRKRRGDGLGRIIQSFGYNMVFRCLFPGVGVTDVNSKPKLLRRELFDKLALTSNDWFLDSEILVQVRRHKARIGEIPTVFLQSESRRSFVRLSSILEFLVNLLRTRWREFFIKA